MSKKSVILPDDRENISELTITILGNANSGKSSLVGILTNPSFSKIADDLIEISKLNLLKKKYPSNKNDENNIHETEKKERAEIYMPKEILDDGNGKSRNSVLQYDHEKITGRTSSITYNYMSINNGYKIISFVDLAGHEAYLKTTVKGVTSSYPDFGFVCIEKGITRITKEHIRLLHILDIPFGIIMSKIDLIPEEKLRSNLKSVLKILKSIKKNPILIKSNIDIYTNANINANTNANANANANAKKDDTLCPIFLLSNKTGFGFDKLIPFINTIDKKSTKIIPNAFVINSIYTVPGFGLVVSGITGIKINKGDELFLGPFYSQNTKNSKKKDATTFQDYEFLKIKVRTIHDDYRNFIDTLYPGTRGCLCIKLDNSYRSFLKSGLILTKDLKKINPLHKFKAKIEVFKGTFCTIVPGYNAFINTGIVRGAVKFNSVSEKNDEQITKQGCIRAGNTTIAELEFIKNIAYCLIPGDIFIFREGMTIGCGKII
jgi:elongation factor 1-alpha